MNHSKWLLLSAVALCACRDLDYPEGDEVENLPPEVEFLSPAPEEVVTLSPIISIDARDPNGVANVTLFCSGVPIYVWTSPPYLANVDLGGCPGATNSEGQKEIALTTVARDALGLDSAPSAPLPVRLDVAVAQLTVTAPGRAAPLGRLELRIQSDRPLGALPAVRIGSQVAQVTERAGAPAALTDFDAIFAPLPGLGTDLYDGGTAEVPLEVLEELERPLLVEVEGHATSGNVTRVVIQVLLSRLAWQRSLPVTYTPTIGPWNTAVPTATDQGLILPIPEDPRFPGSIWIPGTLARADGRFLPFPRPDLLEDPGYIANEMDALGRVVLGGTDPVTGAPRYLYVDPISGTELGAGDYPSAFAPTRLGEALCSSFSADAGSCVADTTRWLECLTPQGLTATAFTSTAGDSTFPFGARSAVSGDVLATTQYSPTGCGVGLSPVFMASPTGPSSTTFPHAAGDPNEIAPDALYPIGNGAFATLILRLSTGVFETFELQRDGTRGGTFFPGGAVDYMGLNPLQGVHPDYILAGRNDGSLITLRHQQHLTVLEQWFPDEETPRQTIRLPGFYISTTDNSYEVAPNVVSGSDGSMAVQLVNADREGTAKPNGRDLVLGIDAQFRARWLYRADPFASGELVGNGTSDVVYYLDIEGQRVTALAR